MINKKGVIPNRILNFMQYDPIMLLNTMDKENIAPVQEEGITTCPQLIFLLQQPFLVNYPLTQLLNCLTVSKVELAHMAH